MANSFKAFGLITGMRPANGGWEFPQPWNGKIIPIRGDDAEDLLRRVREFRIENAMLLGEPERDIAEYIKAKSPGNNGRRRAAVDPVKVSHVRPITAMIEHIKAWLVGTTKRDVDLVQEDDAIRRATFCAQCPQNIDWRTSCGSCNDTIDFKSNNLRQRARFALDKKLRACRLHRIALQSAVFVDRDFLPPRHEKAPEFCWIGKP